MDETDTNPPSPNILINTETKERNTRGGGVRAQTVEKLTKPAVREGFLEEGVIEMRTRKIPLGVWAGVLENG